MINATQIKLNENNIYGYVPTEGCVDYCAYQRVSHSNNLEIQAVGVIFISYSLILAYEYFEEKENYKMSSLMILLSKYSLLIFFIIYFFFIRLKIV